MVFLMIISLGIVSLQHCPKKIYFSCLVNRIHIIGLIIVCQGRSVC